MSVPLAQIGVLSLACVLLAIGLWSLRRSPDGPVTGFALITGCLVGTVGMIWFVASVLTRA